MKLTLLFTLVAALGCQAQAQEMINTQEFQLEDGTRCVWVKEGQAGGLSCDFTIRRTT